MERASLPGYETEKTCDIEYVQRFSFVSCCAQGSFKVRLHTISSIIQSSSRAEAFAVNTYVRLGSEVFVQLEGKVKFEHS